MKFKIKSWDGGSVLFALECASLKLCVEAAVKSGANLSGANLYGAYLSGANLSRANLYGANLSRANLYGANLYGADLYGANLSGANLSRANLYSANLYSANLYSANLSRADLSGANLYGANLSRANLYSAKNLAPIWVARQRITPEEGAFVGWKKLQNGIIARLVIPHDAKRVNALGSRKCRAERVFVHTMWDKNGVELGEGVTVAGLYNARTTYTVGKETVPDKFNDSSEIECSNGIHFYMTKLEAEHHE